MSAPVSQMSAAALPPATEQLALVSALGEPADDSCTLRVRMLAELFEHEGEVLSDELRARDAAFAGGKRQQADNPSASPDGQRVAVTRTVQGNEDVWLLDGLRDCRFTFDRDLSRYPVWSGDNARITFSAVACGLYQKRSNGAGDAERLVASDQPTLATSWSKDGRFLLFNSVDPQTNVDMWVVPTTLREPQGRPEPGRGPTGDRTPSVFLKTPFREGYGMFSPDGRWVAYQSDESGRPEIYVRPFVPPSESASAA